MCGNILSVAVFTGTAISLWVETACAGVNVIPDGDLTDGKFPSFSSDGSKLTCITEDITWNKCLRLEVGASCTNAEGAVVGQAALYAGRDGRHLGFAVTPETTYDFSLELKGGVDRAYVNAYEWTGDDRWKDMRKLKTKPALNGADMRGVRVGDTWTRFKGSFTTSSGAKRAMIEVKLWSSSRHGGAFAPGSFILVDGVTVAASEKNLDLSPDAIRAPWTKAAASGDGVLTDFVDYYSQKPIDGRTSLKITTQGNAFVFDFTCDDGPGGCTEPGAGDSIWKGDTCEIWFGPVGNERRTSQFAVGITGEKYAAVSDKPVDPDSFTAKSVRTDRQWKVRMTVPFAAFGRPDFKPGDDIAFNAARTRLKKGEPNPVWCAVKSKMNDPSSYGRLFYGRYPLGCAARADYEQKRNDLETAALRAKYEKFRNQKVAVAPVPVTSDFEVPFMPKEIFDAPERIRVRAAVNEWKSVPVAVANLSSREGDYIVVLDHQRPFNKDPAKYNPNATDFGLKGFPAGKMRVRRALKMRDAVTPDPSLRLDPLPYADQASSLTVAPREAGVMWFEFDTRGVKPGVYAGDLRVIPLCEYGKFVHGDRGFHDLRYEGEMKVIPFELEVLPIVLSDKRAIRPALMDSDGISEEGYQLQTELGVTDFTVSPWWFKYARDAQGNLDYSKPSEDCLQAQEKVRQHLAWGRKFDSPPHFVVCYNTAPAFRQMFATKNDPALDERLWPQFLKGIRLAMEACGLTPSQWEIEIYDEPPKGIGDDILRMARIAKTHEPTICLQVALGLHGMTTNQLVEIGKYVDRWTPSDASNWPNPEYAAFLRSEIAKGKRVSHYVCYTSMRLSLNSYFRRHAWMGEKNRTVMDSFYCFRELCGPVGTSDFKTVAMGGSVAYEMFGKVVPSIRYMAMREGVMDIKYIAKLQELAPDDPKVAKFIDESVQNVTSRLAHDPAEPDRVREAVTKMILELQAKRQGSAR